MTARQFWLAGTATSSDETVSVRSPWEGSPAHEVCVPGPEHVEAAISAAAATATEAARLPAHVRADALDHVSRELARRSDDIASLITSESGKPTLWARAEVARAVSTFRWAAEEARRWSGELQRLDTEPSTGSRLALTRRFPRGPVLGITPFNFPVNLVAHKVAPALAVGAPILVKPAPTTPSGALVLAELVAETDLPAGILSVLPLPNERAASLVTDPRLPVVSFTGSGPVGWQIRASVPRKHVTLELGGNAAVVVEPTADLDHAAARIAIGGFAQAGQSCISVQRVIVHESVRDELLTCLVAAVKELVTGDPTDPSVQVGPLINEDAACRVEAWVSDAVAAGATILVGGQREGSTYSPTVLVDVPPTAAVSCEEVFGPVVVVSTYSTLDEAFATVNDSRFGLQAGIFTSDLKVAFRAHRELEVGGVVVGDVPTFRADQMPYGGVKESGVGREGVRSAMEDLTEARVLVLSGIDL